MNIFKQTYTQQLPKGAVVTGKKATWTDAKGKKHSAPVCIGKDGSWRITKKSSRYYVIINEQKIPLTNDIETSKQLAKRIAADAQFEKYGVAIKKAKTQYSVATLIDDFCTHLAVKGDTSKHLDDQRGKLQRLLKGQNNIDQFNAEDVANKIFSMGNCRDIDPTSVPELMTLQQAAMILSIKEDSLRKQFQRTGTAVPTEFTREQVLEIMKNRSGGISISTKNKYRKTIIQFGKWLVESERLDRNPFPKNKFKLENANKDIRKNRRVVSTQEIRQILEYLGNSTTPAVSGLSRAHRTLLYLLAIETGFRAKALASLSVNSFDFKANTIKLATKNSKNGKGQTNPMSPDLAKRIKQFIQENIITNELFPGNWYRRASEMIRKDATSAGVEIFSESADGINEIDFHALRHTAVTMIANVAENPEVARRLAGHANISTTAKYMHADDHQLRKAVETISFACRSLVADHVSQGQKESNLINKSTDDQKHSECDKVIESKEKSDISLEKQEGKKNGSAGARTQDQRIKSPLETLNKPLENKEGIENESFACRSLVSDPLTNLLKQLAELTPEQREALAKLLNATNPAASQSQQVLDDQTPLDKVTNNFC